MRYALIGFVVLMGIVAITLIIGYNGLVSSEERVDEAWSYVQSAYARKAELIPALIETAEASADFETDTQTQIAQLRASVARTELTIENAQDAQALDAAGAQLESDLSRLLVIVESYPQLTSTANYRALMDELAGTENRIKVERDRYSSAVRAHNVRVRSFPNALYARAFGFETREGFSNT